MALDQGSFSVFSTYVEMILNAKIEELQDKGVLHVCGDDPRVSHQYLYHYQCSPRMWR